MREAGRLSIATWTARMADQVPWDLLGGLFGASVVIAVTLVRHGTPRRRALRFAAGAAVNVPVRWEVRYPTLPQKNDRNMGGLDGAAPTRLNDKSLLSCQKGKMPALDRSSLHFDTRLFFTEVLKRNNTVARTSDITLIVGHPQIPGVKLIAVVHPSDFEILRECLSASSSPDP